MAFISFHFSLKHIYILFNACTNCGIFKYPHGNFYYYVIGALINWLVCFIFSYYDNKSIKVNKNETKIKIESTKKGFNVKIEEKEEKINDKASFETRLLVIIIYIIYHFIPFVIPHFLKKKIYVSLKNISILFMMVIYFIFLKEKIFLHHFISIFFMIIFMLISDKFKKNIIENIIPSIFFYCYTGFLKSYLKYLMLNKFITPYFCSFVSIFILTIKTYFSYVIEKKNINDSKFTFNGITIIFFICFSLDCFFEHLVIYLFSPFHQVIAEIIGEFFIGINNNDLFDYFKFIGNLFFILIYNEIIVLNFFGLGKNTKENIKKRGELEDKTILENLEISSSSLHILDYNEII